MLDAVFLCCWIFSWCSSIEVVRCHHSRNVWTINVTLFFSSDRWDVKISFVCIAKYGYDFIKGIVGLLVCVNMLCKFFPFKNFLNCCWDFYLQNAIFTVFTYSLSLFVCNSLPAMFFYGMCNQLLFDIELFYLYFSCHQMFRLHYLMSLISPLFWLPYHGETVAWNTPKILQWHLVYIISQYWFLWMLVYKEHFRLQNIAGNYN